jgi:hypothetical protein
MLKRKAVDEFKINVFKQIILRQSRTGQMCSHMIFISFFVETNLAPQRSLLNKKEFKSYEIFEFFLNFFENFEIL